MRGFPSATLLFLFLSPGCARGQIEDLRIPSGSRVRVTALARGDSAVVGRFTGFESGFLVVAESLSESATRIPANAVDGLELSEGYHRGKGALRGALLGLGGSVAMGFLCLAVCPTNDGGANLAPVGGLALGLFVGVPVGALVGSRLLAPEKWRPLLFSRG